jgi:hypothetical protein
LMSRRKRGREEESRGEEERKKSVFLNLKG